MAKKFLGVAPTAANELAVKQQVDDAAYVFTVNDVAPTPIKFGHWWISPSTGTAAIWVPTGTGNGAWYVPQGGGGSGGAAASQISSVALNMPGSVIAVNGAMRWYPPRSITLVDMQGFYGTAGSALQTLTLRKNGTTIATSTIASAQTVGTIATLSQTLILSDYITIDVSTSTGSDLFVRVRFQ
jgi:hypothetical protein